MNSKKTKEDDTSRHLDDALKQCECLEDYEEAIDLWKTYGGD